MFRDVEALDGSNGKINRAVSDRMLLLAILNNRSSHTHSDRATVLR